jgi:hypothetical protein
MTLQPNHYIRYHNRLIQITFTPNFTSRITLLPGVLEGVACEKNANSESVGIFAECALFIDGLSCSSPALFIDMYFNTK